MISVKGTMRKQAAVAIGVVAAIVALVAVWQYLAELRLPLPEGDDQGSRLAFAARWLLLPAVALLAGIVVVAIQRFFVADAIDGARVSQSRLLEITLRYNLNTLCHFILITRDLPAPAQ